MIEMASRSQKAIAVAFIIATALSAVVIAYSSTHYVQVSLAIRSLSTSILDFDVELVDETHIVVSREIPVNNTSSFVFTVLFMEQQVDVNETYAGTTRATFSQTNPLRVLSNPNTNYTLRLNINILNLFVEPEQAEWLLDPPIHKNWVTFIDVFCEGPLVGRFKLSTFGSANTF